MNILTRGLGYLRTYGLSYTCQRLREKTRDILFHPWDRVWRNEECPREEELARQRSSPPADLLISMLVPVYRTRPDLLEALLASMEAQTYPHWEACLHVSGGRAETLQVVRGYARRDPRFRWVEGENNGISGNTNEAFRMSRGAWVVLCDHDDLLTPDALWQIARCISENAPDVVYTDEDKVDEKGRRHCDPHRKPDFCPDNLRAGNYICHLLAVRRELWEQVGGERPAFDGSQDHDLALRLSETAGSIMHLPRVCYHWRRVGASMSHQQLSRCLDAAARAVTEHMTRIGCPGRAVPEDGILRLRYELQPLSVAVLALQPNRSGEEERLRELRRHFPDPASVSLLVPREGESRAEALNRTMNACSADLVLVVDASVSGFSDGFLQELAMYAQRRDVGMVTPLLTDRRGRVLHSGYAVKTDGGLYCPDSGLPGRAPGPFLRNRQARNVSSLSAACFLVRRAAWLSLDPAMGDACAVPDACLRMLNAGLHHVYTPHAAAVCLDAALLHQGNAFSPDAARAFRARWAGWHDPCISQTVQGGNRP